MNSDPILTRFAGDRGSEVLLTRPGAANPFCTAEYGRAMQALRRDVWIVGLQSGPCCEGVALACVTKRRLTRELEFPSLPPIARDTRFWEVVDRLCKRASITDIIAGSFGSTPFELPTLRGEL